MTNLGQIIESRHISLEELSVRSGVKADRLKELVTGADPSMAELRMVSSALHLTILDLMAPSPKEHAASLLFRRAPAPPKYDADASVVRILSRKMGYSLDLVSADRPASRWWDGYFTRGGKDYTEAQQNAELFRKIFFSNDQVSPLLSLPKTVAENMQVLLFVINAPKLDGASAYFDGFPFVFVSSRFIPRMLFTLAHELAHLISHHDASQSFAVLDVNEDESIIRPPRKVEEQYAHAFASCLLMPARGVGIALKKIREVFGVKQDEPVGDIQILYMSRIFGVSFAAAARRCEDLDLLPRGGAISLYEDLRKRFESPEKRAEQLNLPARPEIQFPNIPQSLVISAVEKIRAGELSVEKASAMLGLSIGDLMSANAPTGH